MVASRRRAATSTSNFGVGRRESHVADAFYARFEAPEFSADEEVRPPAPMAESCICGDAGRCPRWRSNSVALVVTSPPYFAGKQYEEELDREGVPGSYLEYLQLLREVFAECKRVLEPGGRIAVNVANLGRKPYRSLAADVMTILQDDLRLLPRGEIVWQRVRAPAAAAPGVLPLADQSRIARRHRTGDRGQQGPLRPSQSPRSGGCRVAVCQQHSGRRFMALTLDVWDIPPESANRVQHPAPFPVELPHRLIELYTFTGDLVLDPFLGSGTTVVAARRAGRLGLGSTWTRPTLSWPGPGWPRRTTCFVGRARLVAVGPVAVAVGPTTAHGWPRWPRRPGVGRVRRCAGQPRLRGPAWSSVSRRKTPPARRGTSMSPVRTRLPGGHVQDGHGVADPRSGSRHGEQ